MTTDLNQIPMSCNFVAGRMETFKCWQFTDTDVCTADKMAESGFFLCGGDEEPDLARCFICLKEMEGWEADDDPSEARYHHSSCAIPSLGGPLSLLSTGEMCQLLLMQQRNCLIAWSEKKMESFREETVAMRKKLSKVNIKQNKVAR